MSICVFSIVISFFSFCDILRAECTGGCTAHIGTIDTSINTSTVRPLVSSRLSGQLTSTLLTRVIPAVGLRGFFFTVAYQAIKLSDIGRVFSFVVYII